jgi:hypothetical protein
MCSGVECEVLEFEVVVVHLKFEEYCWYLVLRVLGQVFMDKGLVFRD